MKKIFCVILFITLVSSFQLNAYTDTGHDDFMEVYPNNEEVKLLYQLSNTEKSQSSENVKKSKFWGWRINYITLDEPVTYIGKILFTRSNASSNDIVFKYTLKDTTTVATSFNFSDSLTIKGSGKGKIDLSLANELEVEYSYDETKSIVETLSYDIVVPSHKKVTMYTTGEGKVSNGCSAKYLFFIRIKYGFWEYIDVKTIHYKIVEEDV